jgi:hypothetical protein
MVSVSSVESRLLVIFSKAVVDVIIKKASNYSSVGASGSVRFESPVTASESIDTATVLLISTSLIVNSPLLLRPAFVSVRPTLSGPSVIKGVSLVPVMVIVTVSVTVAPALSVAVIVNVSMMVSLAPGNPGWRCWRYSPRSCCPEPLPHRKYWR